MADWNDNFAPKVLVTLHIDTVMNSIVILPRVVIIVVYTSV